MFDKRRGSLTEFGRFGAIKLPGFHFNRAGDLAFEALVRDFSLDKLPVVLIVRLDQVLVVERQTVRLTSVQNHPVFRLHPKRLITHINVGVAELLNSIHQFLQELVVVKRMKEARRKSIANIQSVFGLIKKVLDVSPALHHVAIEGNVAEIFRIDRLPEHVFVDHVWEELTIVKVLNGKALFHCGAKVSRNSLIKQK